MESGQTKVFELSDFNIDGEKENTYSVSENCEVSIQILSSSLIKRKKMTGYRIVHLEVTSPNLWLPQTYFCTIQSKSEITSKDYDISINVRLSGKRWLQYGLATLLICMALFAATYYIFSK